MAVTVPPELNWLLDVLAGQNWPAGDEDALRRCAQAWMDAMLAIGNLADNSDVTAQSVMLNADSTSSDQFQAFWSHYLAKANPGFGQSLNREIDPASPDPTTFGGLFGQCQTLAGNLVDQANEVEYTKLVIVITVIITAIMIAMAVAEAIATLGASLVEVGLAMFIGREAVVMAISRFAQMALMMLVPDLIAQGVLVAQGKGWDWNKIVSSGENAVVGGLIGSFLGAGVGKLGWMGEGGNRFLALATHFVEGGLVNDATAVTTLGGQFIWADLSGDQATMAGIEQQLSFSNLAHQFLQGGLLSSIFYLPHMAVPHGAAVTFTTADGKTTFRAIIGDKTAAPDWTTADLADGQLPTGVKLPVFNDKGIRAGTVTFDGDQATVSSLGGDRTPTIDLTGHSYSVTGPDGSLDTYHLDDQSHPELLTQVGPSGEDMRVQTPNGPVDVPRGSTVHQTADGQIYRVDIVKGNEVTTWQTGTPGEPLSVTGVTVHSTVPVLSGVFGVKASTTYTADGPGSEPLGTVDWFAGRLHVTDANQAGYHDAVYDTYSPLASHIPAKTAGLVDVIPAYVDPHTALALGKDGILAHALTEIDQLRVPSADGAASHEVPVRYAKVLSAAPAAGHVRLEISDGGQPQYLRLDLNEARRHLVISTFDARGEELLKVAGLADAPSGIFDVIGHADKYGFVAYGMHVRFDELAGYVRELGLPPDTIIRVCGCEAAAGDGLAKLADDTGYAVRGSRDIVWLDRRGTVFASRAAPDGELRPSITAEGTSDGGWSTCHPHRTEVDYARDQTPLADVSASGHPIPLPKERAPHGPPPVDFALSDVLGAPQALAEPTRELVFEDGSFKYQNVPPAAGVADAAAANPERSQRMAAAREHFLAEHFLAEHQPAVGEAAAVTGRLPAWLDGEPGKILLVTTFWKTDQGGVPVFNQELAKALSAAGHDVYVAVLDKDLPRPVHQIDGVTLFTHTADLPAQVDAVIGHTRFTGQQAQELRENFYPDALLVHFQHMVPGGLGEVKGGEIIYRAPRVRDYQDVVIDEVNGTVTARFVERDFGDDSGVARLDDLYAPNDEQVMIDNRPATVGAAFFSELRKAARNEEMERALVRKADAAFGVGPAIAADTKMLVGDSQVPIVREVIPGLDFTRVITPPPLDEHGKPADGQYNVLLIGRADEAQKGALEAADMIRKLTGPDMNVHLIIRGFALDKPREMEITEGALTRRAGVPVEVRPFTTDPDELTADLSEAHLVIAPGSGEGFGMSAAGAAAVGLPVLVPRSSGYGMFLDQTPDIPDAIRGTLVDQGFADQIPVDRWVDKIGEVLKDLPAARENAAELARLLQSPGQDRTWRGTAKSMLEALREAYRSRADHLALGVSADGQGADSHVIDALRVEIIHDNASGAPRADGVIALGAGDVFDRTTIFGPRSAAELALPDEVRDFAGDSGYYSPAPAPKGELPYEPRHEIVVNVELQHFAENAIGLGYVRATRDLQGDLGRQGYLRVLDDGDRSREAGQKAAEKYQQQRRDAGKPPPGKSALARHVRHADGRFRPFGRLTDETASMHDDVYLVGGGKNRGETDPVTLHGIPVNINYSSQFNTTDPEPKPGYIVVDIPKNASYQDLLNALDVRRQNYAPTGSEFDKRYANALLNLVRDQPKVLSGSFADLPDGLPDAHVAELYKLAKDCFPAAEFDKFVASSQRDAIDSFGRTEVGRFIKSCAGLAVLNIAVEGARCPEAFFTSLMTWNLVAEGKVSLHDALGYFNVMGTDHSGLIAAHAEWTRYGWMMAHDPRLGPPGPKGTTIDLGNEPPLHKPPSPDGWVVDSPGPYSNGLPSVRNSIPGGVEEFQRREREILGLYADSRKLLADLNGAFFGSQRSAAAQRRQLLRLIDELLIADMGWPSADVLFPNV